MKAIKVISKICLVVVGLTAIAAVLCNEDIEEDDIDC